MANPQIEYSPDGTRMKVKFICPNCGRVMDVYWLRTDRPKLVQNIKCDKCPILGFDWSYKPPMVNGQCVYITTCASLMPGDMAEMRIFNERNIYSKKPPVDKRIDLSVGESKMEV